MSILFTKHVSFEHSVSSPRPVITSRREENNKANAFQHPIDSHSQSTSSCLISPHFVAGAIGVGRGAASFLATESTGTTLGHSVYASGPRAAYPIFRDRGPRIIAGAWRVVCRSMHQRSASFKLAVEESNLLVVGNKLLVVSRVVPAQPKQKKGHPMRAFMQQPLLGMVIFRGHCYRTCPCTTVFRGTGSEDW